MHIASTCSDIQPLGSYKMPLDRGPAGRALSDVLHSVRSVIGVDAAFVSPIDGSELKLSCRDARCEHHRVSGDNSFLGYGTTNDASFLDNETLEEPPCLIRAGRFPGTHDVGSLSLPVKFRDGTLIGTLACRPSQSGQDFGSRDSGFLKLLAQMVGQHLEKNISTDRDEWATAHKIHKIIKKRLFYPVFQPIFDLSRNYVVGYEALSRFTSEPALPPNEWLELAEQTAQREKLELAMIERALVYFPSIQGGAYLSVNVSPETVMSERFLDVIAGYPLNRLMLELTEHTAVTNYDALKAALHDLRQEGVTLAIDDAGSGYSSMRHILQLKPDVIKLDRAIIENVNSCPDKQALIAAMVNFGDDTRAQVVAEGVETEAERDALINLGVQRIQGYLIGKPGPLPSLHLWST